MNDTKLTYLELPQITLAPQPLDVFTKKPSTNAPPPKKDEAITELEAPVLDINLGGTGRRDNSDKPSFELVPLTLVADSFLYAELSASGKLAQEMLHSLGQFQASGETWHLDTALHIGNHYWNECAQGFAFGKIKYDEWNWAGGMKWSVPLACAARHALAVLKGEDMDVDSKVHHIGLIMCNVVMLKTFTSTYPAGNDLPKTGLLPILAG